ncbi:MAG: 4-hydroxybenzoate octaprenyltransferase [Gammaproteobacteria bacterium]|nr:4-hydroxybenzoate octaprenyltransferase [Gammaproteobacteria bacterium]
MTSSALTKVSAFLQLMRIKNPIGIFLLLWPTLWGLWFASKGTPPISILVIFILGVIITRSAGCVVNDIADRNFDGHVSRTKKRPLVTGRVQLVEALGLFILLSIIGFCCVLFLNGFTIIMSFLAILLMILYPFAKRITYWPQIILGIAFSWGVLMAYTAISNTLSWESFALFFIAFLWTLSYDTIYAMVDREDDLKIGIKSTAIKLHRYDVLFVTVLHSLVLLDLLLFSLQQKLSLLFYPFWMLAVALTLYQTKLISTRDPQKCFKAFLNNHWFGLFIFCGVVCGSL